MTDVVDPCGLLFRSFFSSFVKPVFSYPLGTVWVRQVINMRFSVRPELLRKNVCSQNTDGVFSERRLRKASTEPGEQGATTVSGGRRPGSQL